METLSKQQRIKTKNRIKFYWYCCSILGIFVVLQTPLILYFKNDIYTTLCAFLYFCIICLAIIINYYMANYNQRLKMCFKQLRKEKNKFYTINALLHLKNDDLDSAMKFIEQLPPESIQFYFIWGYTNGLLSGNKQNTDNLNKFIDGYDISFKA